MTELLPVQIAALKAARGHEGFAYYMEMGLGKTLTALEEFIQLASSMTLTRMVVVCPNSFKSGWKDEVEKHGIDADIHIFVSGGDFYNDEFLARAFNRPPIVAINYEAIRSPKAREQIAGFLVTKPSYLVFDESIQLKTHDSQQTKAAIELSRHAKYKRILSGKPMTQGPHDLWAQMQAIGQLRNRNYYSFRNMFCRLGGFRNKQVIGVMNEDILAQWIDPHVFRATKDEWLPSLPPKVPTQREYKMEGDQWAQYRSMEDEFVVWLTEDKYVTVEAAITKYEKLAQIQCGFIIDEYEKTHDLVSIKDNPRVKALRNIIDYELAGKAIIVYVHRHSLVILSQAFADLNFAFIKGNMQPGEIEAQKVKFNTDPSCRAILLQAIPGRYGHTLLGGPEPENRCSTTIFFENSYSLDTRSQLEDRNHRIGQTANSVVFVDFYSTSMDKKVILSLQRKESIFQTIFQYVKESRNVKV